MVGAWHPGRWDVADLVRARERATQTIDVFQFTSVTLIAQHSLSSSQQTLTAVKVIDTCRSVISATHGDDGEARDCHLHPLKMLEGAFAFLFPLDNRASIFSMSTLRCHGRGQGPNVRQ